MKKLIYWFYKLLIDFIAPPFCNHCRALLSDRKVFCVSCAKLIQPMVSKQIEISNNYTITVHAISAYKEPIKSLILAKTYSNRVACKQLAHVIWDYSAFQNLQFDYLVPIPLHWTRYAWRGYNQSLVISQELSKLSGKPVAKLLKRHKRTLLQSLFSAQDRQRNVHEAFTLINNSNLYTNKTLVLVDDLMTTGATLKEATKYLLRISPKSILAVVAARVE